VAELSISGVQVKVEVPEDLLRFPVLDFKLKKNLMPSSRMPRTKVPLSTLNKNDVQQNDKLTPSRMPHPKIPLST